MRVYACTSTRNASLAATGQDGMAVVVPDTYEPAAILSKQFLGTLSGIHTVVN